MSVGKTTNMQEHPENNKPIVWNVIVPFTELELEPIAKDCAYCGIHRLWESFPITQCGYYSSRCTPCLQAYRKKHYESNKEEIVVAAREYRAANADEIKERRAEKRRVDGDNIRKQARERYIANRDTIRALSRAYYEANKEKCKERFKVYHNRNRNYLNTRRTIRWRIANPGKVKRTKKPMSVNTRITRSLRKRTYTFFKTGKLSSALLGCSIAHLRQWFQFNFDANQSLGFTWANYGKKWEIDHVIPCYVFDLTDPKQRRACFHWTNLAPAGVRYNRSKNKRVDQDAIDRQYDRLMCFEANLNNLSFNIVMDQWLPGDD